jgi:hypothetical protein
MTEKNRGTCHYLCCKIHSLKLLAFYFFAILTVISRAVLMTLSVALVNRILISDWLYWLIEAGPYSYILTGDVLIVFLIDLLI